MTQSIEDAFKDLKIQDLEMSLLRMQQQFRNMMAHARCAVCGEFIDDQRWHLGVMGDSQEIVHADCYEKEEAAGEEEGTTVSWSDEEYDLTPEEQANYYGSGSGQPQREAEAFTGAEVFGGKAAEADEEVQGVRSDAGEHGRSRHQHDAQGARAPVHVAGYRGPDSVSVSERIIDTGGPLTVRVPWTLKAELRERVRRKPIDYSPKKVHTDRIKRFLMMKGLM